jgi:amino acid transporter
MTEGVRTGLQRSLTAKKIVFLVVATAAPLSAMVGTVPLAFAVGNGAGTPGMFIFAGVVLLCFSVGYAAMSRRIVNAGGVYTYLACGLGRPPAVAGGLVAVISYNAAAIGLVGAFGYFAQLVGASYGLPLPWQAWSALAVIAVWALGYRQLDLSTRVLSVLIVAEVAVLVILNAAVVAVKGAQALPVTSLAPSTVFSSAVGVAMMFAFISFIGFESAALYGEETYRPTRSVPLAIYLSVTVMSVFYALSSWVAVGAVGSGQVRTVAAHQLGNLFFSLSDQYVSPWLTAVMRVLLCTSLFAAGLALHNAANRYMFVLGRERVLPSWLGQAHAQHGSPHRASTVQTLLTIIVVAAFAMAGLDPYVNLATSMLGLGTLGIVLLQAAAAISVPAFFAHRPDRHWWKTGVAPLLGAAGLLAAAVLLIGNFALLTATGSSVVTALPWLLLVAVVAGVSYAFWIRSAHPDRYGALANTQLRYDGECPPASTEAQVVGARR